MTTTQTATDGTSLIAAERTRQITEEGWTPEHDAEHRDGALIDAAVSYAIAAEATYYSDSNATFDQFRPGSGNVPRDWPWDGEWWKPSNDPVRNLVKAGALIAAEIDRLLPAPETRLFDGEMSADLELWLGDAFESWLPSTRQLIVRSPDGERTVDAGQWITQDGRVGPTPGSCGDPDCPVLHSDPSKPIHPPAHRERGA